MKTRLSEVKTSIKLRGARSGHHVLKNESTACCVESTLDKDKRFIYFIDIL